MSISSEISRISQNIADSLNAVAAKGVAVPAGSTSDDLPGLIAQISLESETMFRTQSTVFSNVSVQVGTSWTYSGKSFTLTKPAIVRVYQNWNQQRPGGCGLGFNSTAFSSGSDMFARAEENLLTVVCYPGTYYLWFKAGGSGNNNISVWKTE